jgi:hypothetical protein
MKLANWRKGLVACVMAMFLLITGCQTQPPSQFSQAQQESSKPGAVAVAKDAIQGAEFNKFFPPPGDGYERVYTQEKKGFAEAKLKKDGKELAMLAISDTSSMPSAAMKYSNSTQTIAGYPAMTLGNTQTSILVNNRYQVKVLSRDPSFTQADRAVWLEKFDLKGLARLK